MLSLFSFRRRSSVLATPLATPRISAINAWANCSRREDQALRISEVACRGPNAAYASRFGVAPVAIAMTFAARNPHPSESGPACGPPSHAQIPLLAAGHDESVARLTKCGAARWTLFAFGSDANKALGPAPTPTHTNQPLDRDPNRGCTAKSIQVSPSRAGR